MNQNNRNNNRRRGRGNNRGGQGGGNQGNRIDSRARGNAPQLLEKYKKLAHDASLNGDRVQTEYYLQFADHYFRVIADSRTPREEQRPRRDDRENGGDQPFDSGFDAADEFEDAEEAPRRPREQERERNEEPAAEGERGAEGDEIEAEERNPFIRESRSPQPPRSRGRGRPAKNAVESGETEEAGFDAAVLPPSIAREEEAAPAPARPRTRTRRPRPADDGDQETLEAVS